MLIWINEHPSTMTVIVEPRLSRCYKEPEVLGRDVMPLWQRSLITLVAMVLTSFVAAVLWRNVFNFDIPGYLSGVVGGVTAVPIWEFLKRVGPSE